MLKLSQTSSGPTGHKQIDSLIELQSLIKESFTRTHGGLKKILTEIIPTGEEFSTLEEETQGPHSDWNTDHLPLKLSRPGASPETGLSPEDSKWN